MEERAAVEYWGDYKVIAELGHGLWSRDVLAEHRFIKKRYILKILPSELSSSENFMRVFQEVIVQLAAIRHASLVAIENVSREGDRYFVVTEENGGTISLAQYLSGRKLSEEEVVHLIQQLCDALELVHSIGLAHGQIHLHSVHVSFFNGIANIYLPEVGFASLLRERMFSTIMQSGSARESITRIRDLLMFEAPEEQEVFGREADVYSVGVLAYYLLVGSFPWGSFPKPSLCMPDSWYDWDGFILSCLQQQREARPKCLREALRRKTSGEQLQVTLDSCREPLREMEIEDTPIELGPPSALIREGERLCEVKEEQHAFVLVEAKSIDEAMVTTVDSEEELESSEGYANPLQSLLAREPVVSRYVEVEREEIKPQPLLTEMIFIEGGEFSRGSGDGQRDELPVHNITLPGFFLDIHPVTNEQFVRFLECVGSEQDEHYNELIRLKDSRIQRRSGRLIIEPGYAKHPVVGVTWYGASSYACWIGKRLPSEAEWEVAASGGKLGLRYPIGEEIDKSKANFFSSDTTPVMSYPSSILGLYDMAGNVYEWCQDWYSYDFYESSALEPDAPLGPPQGVYRVLRGGCWKSLKDDLRCAHRHRNNPGAINSTYGFRCAKDVK
ncbi:SUMF1/EgtB/PvdO family nonheme iron enzyme [Chlamydia trachomatis]|uniref:SUMF1/EgtB/PvdO family nonheme iron enzyme n=1 Tax=Chlamydia trachomatis TaxID=813 RepID=UPI0001D635EF|nr:SUMF1/EgtB/PvdO family nonheme iron enzyme [Chlamydia trachomatis]ADH17835.1 serine-threonine-protein kinase [Chlamydia trachomatis G/9768]ADH18754.1 serine-threonine-protein kinase [Chlamydia trachomatis G/11222]ADH19682.1 serine-threonine-protein kinase [Chlamydia trachomatis G/11074]ADH96778.1 serine-threonine-protein kinase [Chlamydia trachomatis G/9301]ROT56756.1 serine/threonine-protein kinase pkn1 [Chlamydia trachomatis]